MRTLSVLLPLILVVVVAAKATAAATTTTAEGPAAERRRPCWDNVTSIYEDHLQHQPPGSHNVYWICPGTYQIGHNYGNGLCCEGGHYPLITRTNTEYRCGYDGGDTSNKYENSEHECVFVGGDTHVLINDGIFDDPDDTVVNDSEVHGVPRARGAIRNAVVDGFTFRSPKRGTTFASAPGDVTFRNCIFEDQANEGPILAFYGPPDLPGAEGGDEDGEEKEDDDDGERRRRLRMEERESLLESGQANRIGLATMMKPEEKKRDLASTSSVVQDRREKDNDGDLEAERPKMNLAFDRCLFRGNAFAPPVDMMPTYGIVSARSPDNVLLFDDCVFRDNVYSEVR